MNFDLNINNFGTIKKAKLKIRPFTVISGKNSTGKSFVTRGLYSVFNILNKDLIHTFLKNTYNELFIQLEVFSTREDEKYMEHLRKVLNDIAFIEHTYLNTGSVKNIDKIDLKNKITHIADRLSEMIALLKSDESQISRFSYHRLNSLILNLEKLEQLLYDQEQFELDYIENELTKSFCENFQVSSLNKLINKQKNPKSARISLARGSKRLCDIEMDENSLTYEIFNSFINECKSFKNVLYLESPIYFRMLRAIRRIGRFPLSNQKINLSGVPQYVYDLIDHLEDKRYIEHDIHFPQLMRKVSQELKGYIDIKNSGVNLSYIDEEGNDFPLEQTAMGIINLGIINLLINNGILEKGSYIFIDEPETNLHPEWQILMIDILYALSLSGVNVVITTHSNSILKKIQKVIELTQKENNLQADFFGINYLKGGKDLSLDENPLLATMAVLEDLNLPYASVEFGLM